MQRQLVTDNKRQKYLVVGSSAFSVIHRENQLIDELGRPLEFNVMNFPNYVYTYDDGVYSKCMYYPNCSNY